MFAAAAIFAQMAFDAALHAAKWLATKALVLALLMLVLPWVLKGVIIWAFEWLTVYGQQIFGKIMELLSSTVSSAGMPENVVVELTGVGGYLAVQTGLIEYASIIFTGWGLYWVVAVLAKTPTRL